MLLVIIVMATLTLGLLFSGWFTPTPGRAQSGGGDPSPSNVNTNCVATTSVWSGNCPSNVTSGSVSPTSINQCGVTAPTRPTNIVVPVYSPTNIFTQIISYDTTNCTPDTNTENITYSVGGVQWNPPLPGTITNTFSSTAYVNVTSSDTTNCPSPGRVDLGTVTWNLPCPTVTNCTIINTNIPISGFYGARIAYNFNCCDGWYTWESITPVQMCVQGSIDCMTNANSDGCIWRGGDYIGTIDPSGDSCTYQVSQTIYFAPVGGGGTTNNNSTCSINNTQTITITRTNSPPADPHGTVTTTVTIGGGASATYTY